MDNGAKWASTFTANWKTSLHSISRSILPTTACPICKRRKAIFDRRCAWESRLYQPSRNLFLFAVGDVNRMTVYGERRLFDCLGQGGMAEYHHSQILGAGAELHGNRHLLYQIRRAGADNVATQNAIRLGMGKYFDKTILFVGSQGTGNGDKRKDAYVIALPICLKLLLGFTNGGDFRVCVNNVGNSV